MTPIAREYLRTKFQVPCAEGLQGSVKWANSLLRDESPIQLNPKPYTQNRRIRENYPAGISSDLIRKFSLKIMIVGGISLYGKTWSLFHRIRLSRRLVLTNSMAYGTRRFNAAFTRDLPVRGPVWRFWTPLFLQREVVSLTPNPQAGGPLLVGCPRLLIQYIRS